MLKPPFSRLNPYDGSRMPHSYIKFPTNEISYPGLKSWLLDQLPDYSTKVGTTTDLKSFQKSSGQIAKVYLLSAKQSTPQIYAALTANFRDKIDFAFLSDDSAASATFKSQFEIDTVPTLLLTTVGGSVEVYTEKMKLPELIKWLTPHALPEKRVTE